MRADKLPQEFLREMKALLGTEYDAYIESLAETWRPGLRVNGLKLSSDEFRDLVPWRLSPVPWEQAGFYYDPDEVRPSRHPWYYAGLYYLQEPSAMAPAACLPVTPGDRVLDLCAAPGGKSVYFAGIGDNVKVLSCDIYHHRLQLIQQYARRMGVKLDVRLLDATVANKSFDRAFDVVLCDVPCSNLGVAAKKPDVYLFKDKDAIFSLTQTQAKILENGAGYVKEGGALVYSTCTLLKEENEEIVKRFLKANKKYKLESQQVYLPDDKGSDGFFVAKLRRIRA